ncbi:hypothetical protein [Streptacidiphilus melanogenes]|uniref:hypothetical protein n=1 Tax=Streptacidiphilus melanogenes TaxID=411235 RepID=UPI000A7FEE66|nr:hypothetical protein [Streptacidiphilus melanogenes]
MPDQPCNACSGQGGTDKVEYTYETDSDGKLVAQEHRYYSPCTSCGGSGRIA